MVSSAMGGHEEFTREKLLSRIKRPVQKRPVSPQTMEDLVDHIVGGTGAPQIPMAKVPADFVGTWLCDGLRDIDEVA